MTWPIFSMNLRCIFNPYCVEACNKLGVVYKDRDNLDKAVECYQENVKNLTGLSLSIKPNFSHSLNNFGVFYSVQVQKGGSPIYKVEQKLGKGGWLSIYWSPFLGRNERATGATAMD